MNSWFNLTTFDVKSPEDIVNSFSYDDMVSNSFRVHEIMREEIRILRGNSKKLFVAGYSQGCIMQFYCDLTFDETIGGLIGLSGYFMPTIQENEANSRIPIFLYHGKIDQLINFELAKRIYEEKLDNNTHNIEKVFEDGQDHEVSDNGKLKELEWFINQTNQTSFTIIIKPMFSFIFSILLVVLA